LIADYDVMAQNVDESFDDRDVPVEIARGLAIRKAMAGLADWGEHIVIGSDTIVVLDGCVMNKPVDRTDAAEMLSRLSGRSHDVFTGVALAGPSAGDLVSAVVQSEVHFEALSSQRIEAYLDTGIWTDKAGGYGIQGDGGQVVSEVDGCYLSVAGFPVCTVGRLLQETGVQILSEAPPCGLRSSRMCPSWSTIQSGMG
jgi:septum formation protein